MRGNGVKHFNREYAEVVQWAISQGAVSRKSKVLVVCGGVVDRDTLLTLGFTNVSITNIDPRQDPAIFAPFHHGSQSAETLTYDDDTFDFGIVHEGLHHCGSPHRALLELYRVCREGLMFVEPVDNLLTRLATIAGFGQQYECATVVQGGHEYGGVNCTGVPNHIYRWTKREVEKTIRSFNPTATPRMVFTYRLFVPWDQLLWRRSMARYAIVKAAAFPICGLQRLFPSILANNMVGLVSKPRVPQDLHPWLELSNGTVISNRKWFDAEFDDTRVTPRAP
jgi:SAM-dependent methyltransferase